MKEEFGLVLEGGGAKGAYEIGACKALIEMDVKITGVSGTSVGALNGAMVAQHEIDKAYQLWHDIHPLQIMNIDAERLQKLVHLEIKPDDIKYYLKMLGEIIAEGGIDVTPLQKLIKKHVNEGKLRKSNIIFGMVTVSFTNRRALELFAEDIPEGQIADYLFASANFPLFRSAKIGDKIYLDGGIYDNLPIRMLVKKGYKSLITIQVGGMGRKRKIKLDNLHVINIEAKENLGGPLNFNAEKARHNLKLGYFDAYRVMKNLAGHYYYINLEHQEDYFVDYFSHLSPELVVKVARTLSLKENIPYRRLLFERILPRLVEILKLPEDSSYQDIALTLAEKIALEVGLDRFRIYSFSDLIDCLTKQYNKRKKIDEQKEHSLISHFGFLSLFSGDNILKKLVQNLLSEEIISSWKEAQSKKED
jgi:NTE family protein